MEERRKWWIRMIADGYIVGNITHEGTLEETREFAREWASEGRWTVPVVEVWVEIWDKNPYEATDAELVEEWSQYSYDPSKPDPYREAQERYTKEHEDDPCPRCGREGPVIYTPGLGGMDRYLRWREVEPHAYLAWCQCACGAMWACVGEDYVRRA